MAFPIKVCVVCSEEFELKPDKPGFANRCPQCSEPEATPEPAAKRPMDAIERKAGKRMRRAGRLSAICSTPEKAKPSGPPSLPLGFHQKIPVATNILLAHPILSKAEEVNHVASPREADF
jgi:hypothetical protein